MARSHGKILVDVWLDPDFIALDTQAQWAYFMLLSQPKLTLVGSIDYRPNHWAEFSPSLRPIDVEAAIRSLELGRFVCVDRGTDELLVRSMTRHDGLRAGNSKLLKGLWAAWKGIASAGLRKVAVDNMPESLFGHEDTPKAAEEIRRSPRMDWPIDWVSDCPIEGATDQPIAPPSTYHRPPSAIGRSDRRSPGLVDKSIMLPGSGLVHSFAAGELNPNPAAGADAVVVHAFGPRTSGEAS